ncbi:unnamed protein product [Ilex paraguariensis]|uniref:Uncharacterized protein n=1 Tax=Ilex paraguariensis TaxID=185542 RepID=A0ABC8T6K0_9AQUA
MGGGLPLSFWVVSTKVQHIVDCHVNGPRRPIKINRSGSMRKLRSFKIYGLLEKTLTIVFKRHLSRRRAQSVGDRKQNLAHLVPKLVEIDGPALLSQSNFSKIES